MKLIVAAVITATHGFRGNVKLRPTVSEPSNIFAYSLYDKLGNFLAIKPLGGQASHRICSIDCIQSLEDAKSKVGTNLYLNRLELPELPEGRFYTSDLIGLPVLSRSGKNLGKIDSIKDFGAGQIVVICTSNGQRTSYPLIGKFFPYIGKENAILEDITIL